MIYGKITRVVTTTFTFLPYQITNVITSAKYFIANNFAISMFIFIKIYKHNTIFGKQLIKKLYSTLHEQKPNTVFHAVVVMLKCISSIIWRINVNTFYLPCEVLLKSAEREKIIAVNEHIARPRFPVGETAGFDLPKTIFRCVKE